VYLGGGRAHCKIRKVKMHHAVLDVNPRPPLEVDHINGNGLDNRRGNLRVTGHSSNVQKGQHRVNSYGFLGIRKVADSPRRPWRARISNNGKRIELGNHATPEQAARAYDEAARKIHGPHAKTNF